MATLAELTVQILSQRLAKKEMTLDEMQAEMLAISKMIRSIDEGTAEEPAEAAAAEESKPQKINMKKVFRDKEVICLICNKGFTTLKRHLRTAHDMDDKAYKQQFGIPPKTKLVAREYAEKRRNDAQARNQGEVLARARVEKAAKMKR